MKNKLPSTPAAVSEDPTIRGQSHRPRGIISLSQGYGPSAGVLFALTGDNNIYTYSAPFVSPLETVYTHSKLRSDCFYLSIEASPCGRWLASSGRGQTGNAFIFDVRSAGRAFPRSSADESVHLQGHFGQAGSLAWDESGGLASCADDGTVRMWRRDEVLRARCEEDPEAAKWNYKWGV